MNTIQQGNDRQHQLHAEAPHQDFNMVNQDSRAAVDNHHVFQRLPANGVPEAAAREWARADAAGYGTLSSEDQRDVALAMITLNQHANADYRQALQEIDPTLHDAAQSEGVKWLKERTTLLPDQQSPTPTAAPIEPLHGNSAPGAAERHADAALDIPNTQIEASTSKSHSHKKSDAEEFSIPDSLRKRYLIADDKYYLRDMEQTLAFEDKGKKIATDRDDADIARSMVDLAAAKSWTTIKIRGTAQFKREVWLAAVQRGMEVDGYRPTKLDKARLEEWRLAQPQPPVNEIERGVDREHATVDVASAPPDKTSTDATKPERTPQPATSPTAERLDSDNLSKQQQLAIDALKAMLRSRGDSERAIDLAANMAAERFVGPRVYVGKMVAHGPAPYQHDKDNEDSYYLILQTKAGERTVWGVDLPRALGVDDAKPGDEVVLAYQGKKYVTVKTAERDPTGKLTGKTIDITAERNTWDARKLDTLRSDVSERLRDEAALADKAQHRQPVVKVYDVKAPAPANHARTQTNQRDPERGHPAAPAR